MLWTHLRALKVVEEHSVKVPNPEPTSSSPVLNALRTLAPCAMKNNEKPSNKKMTPKEEYYQAYCLLTKLCLVLMGP